MPIAPHAEEASKKEKKKKEKKKKPRPIRPSSLLILFPVPFFVSARGIICQRISIALSDLPIVLSSPQGAKSQYKERNSKRDQRLIEKRQSCMLCEKEIDRMI